jgi:hypothetical protein
MLVYIDFYLIMCVVMYMRNILPQLLAQSQRTLSVCGSAATACIEFVSNWETPVFTAVHLSKNFEPEVK